MVTLSGYQNFHKITAFFETEVEVIEIDSLGLVSSLAM